MSPSPRDRWPEVRAVLERVQAVPTNERRLLIETLCGGDRALRDEVLSMIRHIEAEDDFLTGSPVGRLLAETMPFQRTDAGQPAVGAGRIGRYRLIRRLGEGGMGIVYEAEQDEPHRLVALKVLRFAHADDESLRRFAREAETLARLRHPSIAGVYEAGCESDGTRWIAMELVHGRTLDAWLREERPDLARTLRLFAALASGIHAAHLRGVIHRDLKASNILVEADDAPRILDFGLARIHDASDRADLSDRGDHHPITRTGRIFGTLSAMSPEQACGKPDDVDARSDIYALGLLLYEALAGAPPYDIGSLPLPDAVARIRDSIPPPPSVASIAAGASQSPKGDLDTIVLTALAKEPERRYQSAAAFAADLRSWMADEPIAARPPTTTYLLKMLLRRHRMLFRSGLAVAGVLVLALAALLAQNRALVEARSSEARASERTSELLYRSQIAHAEQLVEIGRASEAVEVLDRCAPERRGWEWTWLRGLIPEPLHSFALGDRRVLDLREVQRSSRHEAWALTAGESGAEVLILRGGDRDADATAFAGPTIAGQVIGGVILPGGDVVVAVRGESDRVLIERHGAGGMLWQIESGLEGVERIALGAGGTLAAITEATRDSSRLAAMDVLVVDCDAGRAVARAPDIGFATALAWHDSEPVLAVATIRRRLVTLHPIRGERKDIQLAGSIRAMAWPVVPAATPGGGSSTDPERLLIAPAGNLIRELRSHEGGIWRGPLRHGVSAIAVGGRPSEDGVVGAASMGGEVVVWRSDGRRVLVTSVAGSGPTGVTLSADGTRIWSYRRGGAIACWPITQDPPPTVDGGRPSAGGAASLSPLGGTVLRVTGEGLRWFDAGSLQPLVTTSSLGSPGLGTAEPPGTVSAVVALDDENGLGVAGTTLLLVHRASVEVVAEVDDRIESMALLGGQHHDRVIVTVERSGRLRLWDAQPLDDRRVLIPIVDAATTSVAEATVGAGRDGLLVVGDRQGVVHTFAIAIDRSDPGRPVARMTPLGSQPASEQPITALTLAEEGEGSKILFGDGDGTIGCVTQEGLAWTVRGHTARVTGIAVGLRVGQGAHRVISASLDRSLRLWDLADGAPIMVIDESVDLLLGVAVDERSGGVLAIGADALRLHRSPAVGFPARPQSK
jgi:predicted Ser/Thr protein kinase/WD40 repeat protein